MSQSTIEKIIASFRRSMRKPLSPEEELRNLEKRLKADPEPILVCPKCGAYLKWRDENGDIKELFPLKPTGRCKVFSPEREFCPKCGSELKDCWRLKQKVYDEEGGNRDYAIIY